MIYHGYLYIEKCNCKIILCVCCIIYVIYTDFIDVHACYYYYYYYYYYNNCICYITQNCHEVTNALAKKYVLLMI